MNRWISALSALLVLAAAVPAVAKDIRTERVTFAPGQATRTIEARIKGDETVDYLVAGRAGQPMNISMASRNGAAYFNILAPGETVVAFFNGSVSDNQYEGVLPATGDYRIRVYLMRSAARRGEVADYRLEVIAGAPPAAVPASGKTTDALVAGTPYHATGSIPCAMAPAQPMGSCTFGVIRKGGGSGSVTVTGPDGRVRTIVFEAGTARRAEGAPAGAEAFRATKQGDLNRVEIGDERYEIPDAAVFGG